MSAEEGAQRRRRANMEITELYDFIVFFHSQASPYSRVQVKFCNSSKSEPQDQKKGEKINLHATREERARPTRAERLDARSMEKRVSFLFSDKMKNM